MLLNASLFFFFFSFFFFKFYFRFSLSLVGNWGIGVAFSGKVQQPQEQRYPFLSVCAVVSCVQTIVCGCQCLGFLTCAQLLMHAIAQGSYTDTVRESALGVNSGRKIPWRTGDWNPRQYSSWLFSRTLSGPHEEN